MAQRVQFRRRNPYATKSNQTKIIKTPGAKLHFLHVSKKASKPTCNECGSAILGVVARRPHEYQTVPRSKRTVQRAYGGSLCANCVKNRVVRAFLVEEQKIVKRVVKEKAAQQAAADKKKSKK